MRVEQQNRHDATVSANDSAQDTERGSLTRVKTSIRAGIVASGSGNVGRRLGYIEENDWTDI